MTCFEPVPKRDQNVKRSLQKQNAVHSPKRRVALAGKEAIATMRAEPPRTRRTTTTTPLAAVKRYA